MCGSGYLTYPKFLPSKLIFFFLQIRKLDENSRTKYFVLLFSSNFRIWRKNTYQNDHLKWKSKFFCIQSLVLEVKRLKQGYIFKNRHFFYEFFLFHFQACLNIPRKKSFQRKKSILPTYPDFFQGVT